MQGCAHLHGVQAGGVGCPRDQARGVVQKRGRDHARGLVGERRDQARRRCGRERVGERVALGADRGDHVLHGRIEGNVLAWHARGSVEY